jgi:hypothetical protein
VENLGSAHLMAVRKCPLLRGGTSCKGDKAFSVMLS